MISIIGDSADELAKLQLLLDAGALNSDENVALDVTYKLSSGGVLLVDEYNHIVGSEPKACNNCGWRLLPDRPCIKCYDRDEWMPESGIEED